VVPSVSPAPAGVVPTLLDPPPVQTASRSKSSTELTIKKDAVIGISIDSSVSSHTAKVDDKINARVSRDVMVDGRVAIPANARLEGMVTLVERAGSTGGRDRIGVRFTTLVLPDKTRMPIQTETIFRGPEAGEVSLARSPNPVQGARGTAGAARNSAFNTNPGVPALAPGARSDAFIPGGSQLTVKLTAPLFVIIGRED
jgi:hypothetical protein